jgi:hypothetical protein
MTRTTQKIWDDHGVLLLPIRSLALHSWVHLIDIGKSPSRQNEWVLKNNRFGSYDWRKELLDECAIVQTLTHNGFSRSGPFACSISSVRKIQTIPRRSCHLSTFLRTTLLITTVNDATFQRSLPGSTTAAGSN